MMNCVLLLFQCIGVCRCVMLMVDCLMCFDLLCGMVKLKFRLVEKMVLCVYKLVFSLCGQWQWFVSSRLLVMFLSIFFLLCQLFFSVMYLVVISGVFCWVMWNCVSRCFIFSEVWQVIVWLSNLWYLWLLSCVICVFVVGIDGVFMFSLFSFKLISNGSMEFFVFSLLYRLIYFFW